MFGKLDLLLKKPMHKEEFYRRIHDNELIHRVRTINRIKFIQIGHDEKPLLQAIDYYDSDFITKIHSNPSHFATDNDYFLAMNLVLTLEEFLSSKVIRLDLTVDYPEELEAISRGYFLINKRKITVHIEKGRVTGFDYGRGQEKATNYDKIAESNRPKRKAKYKIGRKTAEISEVIEWQKKYPKKDFSAVKKLARLELKLLDKKIPFETVADIWSEVPVQIHSKVIIPFHRVLLRKVILADPNTLKTKSEFRRFYELKAHLNFIGFIATRKILDRNNNFAREYGTFIQHESYGSNPSDFLVKSLNAFLTPKTKSQ